MSHYTDEEDDVVFSEPILAQKQVKTKIVFAASAEWESKDKNGDKNGKKFDACKLTINIDDSTVKTEHPEAKPKLTIEDQFNVVGFPYWDKKTGELKKLGRSKLYQLEEAFGFEPKFQVNGSDVEPFITKTGRKVAPKIEGVKRVLNSDFFDAYFFVQDDKAIPNMDNWVGKTVYCDIEVETSEQYGSKNVISRYVRAPQI